jgi:glucokinase
MVLAGDIGGTSTRLGLFDVNNGSFGPVLEQTYPSRKYQSLSEVVSLFLAAHASRVRHACFGVAGPVQRGRVATPNLPWEIDALVMAQELNLTSVKLINDLEANAYGIAVLKPQDFVALNEGASDAEGNAAVISVGTGLGEAGMYWDGAGHHPFACEGGHVDFAPRDALETELLQYLRKKFGRVSYERVLSGPGLLRIYEFLRDTGRGEVPPALAQALGERDASAVISEAALNCTYEICVKALNLFVSFYGAEAGNLALKVMATGGVFVGGGVAPKILPVLKGPHFMSAFADKGRMRPLLEAIPIKVILRQETALLGAAQCAGKMEN